MDIKTQLELLKIDFKKSVIDFHGNKKFVDDFLSKYQDGYSYIKKHPWYYCDEEFKNKVLNLSKEENKLLTEWKNFTTPPPNESRVMLSLDIVKLGYYFGKNITNGLILEIGTYTGGFTLPVAWGLEKNINRNRVKFLSVENNQKIHDILMMFLNQRNLIQYTDVSLTQSDDPKWIQKVANNVNIFGKIKLIMIDADGFIARDLLNFWEYLETGCTIILDDWISVYAKEKVVSTQKTVELLVNAGKARMLGIWEWGTAILEKK